MRAAPNSIGLPGEKLLYGFLAARARQSLTAISETYDDVMHFQAIIVRRDPWSLRRLEKRRTSAEEQEDWLERWCRCSAWEAVSSICLADQGRLYCTQNPIRLYESVSLGRSLASQEARDEIRWRPQNFPGSSGAIRWNSTQPLACRSSRLVPPASEKLCCVLGKSDGVEAGNAAAVAQDGRGSQ